MASTKSTVAITLTALAAGAALGILFAPDSGKGTRKKISKKGEELRKKLTDLVKEGSDMIDKLKDNAEEAADDAKSKARNVKDRAKEAVADAANTRSSSN